MHSNQNNSRLPIENENTAIDRINIQPVRSMTCYICFENITTMKKEFGIQNNCDHVFCFDCLSTWRRTVNFIFLKSSENIFLSKSSLFKSSAISKDVSQQCPLCRIRSTFIARSCRCFNNHNDKQSLINAHKLRLKSIPCRILLQYGYCRFGRRCYYSHHIPITSHRWSSFDENQQNSSNMYSSNTIRTNNEQQVALRRYTNNLYRYRPY